jgi:hypothetical protein
MGSAEELFDSELENNIDLRRLFRSSGFHA